MFAYLVKRATLITTLIGLVISVFLFLEIQRLKLELVEQNLDFVSQKNETREANKIALKNMEDKIEDAFTRYKQAEEARSIADSNARLAVGRLRKFNEDLPARIDRASKEAVSEYALKASAALGECSKRYYEVGKRADEYYNAYRLLDESWPTTRIESEGGK